MKAPSGADVCADWHYSDDGAFGCPDAGLMLQSIGGWRTIFGALTLYGALILVLVYLFLPASGGSGGKIDHPLYERRKLSVTTHVLQTHRALGFLFLQAFSFGSMFCF